MVNKLGFRLPLFLFLIGLFGSGSVFARQATQEFIENNPWEPMYTSQGLQMEYMYYNEADGKSSGLVVKLSNLNDYAISYRFKIVFRSGSESEKVELVRGSLEAEEVKTGSLDGLFWIPFEDKREITHVGIRGFRLSPH